MKTANPNNQLGLSAIETMKKEIRALQIQQMECVTEEGFVKSHCRYRYQILTAKLKDFKSCLDYLQAKAEVYK